MIEPREDSDSEEDDYESNGLDSAQSDCDGSDSTTPSEQDDDESESDESVESDGSDSSPLEKNKTTEFKKDESLWKDGLSLEELMKIREKVGTKKFNNQILDMKSSSPDKSRKEIKLFKRENRNRPQEISSKIKVKPIRQVVNVPKSKFTPRDPRFDNLCGSEFNEEIFNQSYSFLDDIKNRETSTLTKLLKESKSEKEKKKIKYLLLRMKQQAKAKEQRALKRELERTWKKEERQKIEKGFKKPYFMTKADKRKIFMEKRNEELKQSGSYGKVEARRDKKRKSKDARVMPYARRTAS